ncbi:MAG: hypothetical protein RL375_1964 [Pseudomonadota bacterium]|jgi:putative nucleotidyltransferase with HDIG domain
MTNDAAQAAAGPPVPRPSTLDTALLLTRVQALPALPRAVLDALAMLRSETSGVDECAERIAVDPALTARALRLANSAFYGVSGRVATLRDAVHLLGRHTLGTLLTAAAVMGQFKGTGLGANFHDVYWRHALGVALASQAMARQRAIDPEIAFATGLLHDIGRLALAAYFEPQHREVLAYAHEADIEPVQAERLLLGIDHAAIGATMARQWHFPTEVVQAIAWHHLPTQMPDRGNAAQVVDLVHVSDAIAHALDLNHLAHDMVPDLDEAAWDRVRLTPEQAARVLRDTEHGVVALGRALGL